MMNRLRSIRRAQDLTQEELADLTGTTRNTVGRIERGLQEPRRPLAQRIAAALGVTVGDVWPAEDEAA